MLRYGLSTEIFHFHSGPHHNRHNHHNNHKSPQPPQSTNTQGRSQRRRERRLRCMLRHERQTVTMALADQLRHSANRVERDAALRRQTTESKRGGGPRGPTPLRGQTRRLLGDAAGSGSGGATAGWDPAAHKDRLRAGSRLRLRRAADGGTVGGSRCTPRPQCLKLPRQWWSKLHPRQQCSKLLRRWWSILPLRLLSKLPSPVVEYSAPAPAVCSSTIACGWRMLHPRLQLSNAPTAEVEFFVSAPTMIPSPSACRGVYCTHNCCPSASACGGENCTRACWSKRQRVVECIAPAPAVLQTPTPVVEFFALAPAVVLALSPVVEFSCTRASFSSESPAPGGFLSPAPTVLWCWRSSRLCPRTEFPPLVVDMIFLSLLGGDALRMRLAVCTIGMCTRARRDGRLL